LKKTDNFILPTQLDLQSSMSSPGQNMFCVGLGNCC